MQYYRIDWWVRGREHVNVDFVSIETNAGLGAWLSQLDLVGGIIMDVTRIMDREELARAKHARRQIERKRREALERFPHDHLEVSPCVS